MTTFDAAVIGAEAAARRVTLVGDFPARAQWTEIVKEIDAIPTGARFLLEAAGLPIVLVMGECNRVAGLAGVPAGTKGFTSYCGCVVSVPHAYPPDGRTTSYVVIHEAGHGVGRAQGDMGRDIDREWPWSRQGDWREVCEKLRQRDPEDAFAEQFSYWCTTERGGFDRAECHPAARAYFREKARQGGWFQNGSLYFPR